MSYNRNSNSNGNLEISSAPTKAKSQALKIKYTIIIIGNKIDSQSVRIQRVRQASIVFSGWCLELKCEGGKWMTRNQDKICER